MTQQDLDRSDSPTETVVAESVAAQPVEHRVSEALRGIYDPEIPVNIYDLGLIYKIEASASGDIKITMTLTTPNCPVAGSMPAEVERRARAVEGVRDVTVDLVWDPPWSKDMMSEAARLELGFM
jgi:FeS assembly SUF system protein